ncbi:MAG: hypothetical protein M3R55_06870 [Acidobacteriota bacterium]|nr:hypothetical protein [Acidobacteriota bacterium]
MHEHSDHAVPPSRLWRQLPLERRIEAAQAFWEADATDEAGASEQIEAILALSRHMKFRPQSMQAMPADKRARYLAQLPAMPDSIAARALVSYHLTHQRPMMGAFLDALGITHEDGLITAENLEPLARPALAGAAANLTKAFPPADVSLYLNTLLAQDPQTWGELGGLPQLE